MKYPNFKEEKNLQKKGYEIIIGIDEVGRGPLAGPVVACAVFIWSDSQSSLREGSQTDEAIQSEYINSRLPRRLRAPRNDGFLQIKDSKQLSEKQREKIYAEILKCPDFVWAVGQVNEKVIDKINILNATKLAMQKAVKNLQKKILHKKLSLHKIHGRGKNEDLNLFALIDGNMKFDDNWFGDDVKYKSIIKGDQKVFSIAMASIIAKVYRDNLMVKYSKKYPQYGFEIHKGYGTKRHYESLTKHGLCKLHRKNFFKNYYKK